MKKSASRRRATAKKKKKSTPTRSPIDTKDAPAAKLKCVDPTPEVPRDNLYLVFKVKPNTEPKMYVNFPYSAFSDIWAGAVDKNLTELNEAFATQIRMITEYQSVLCWHFSRPDKIKDTVTVNFPGDPKPKTYEIGASDKAKESLSSLAHATEMYRMDRMVLDNDGSYDRENPVTTDVYACVLIRKGEYFGHIYAWISANPKGRFCSFVGIRARIDNAALGKDRLEGTALYLLEAVRQFALAKGATHMYVIDPVNRMPCILQEKGFVKGYRTESRNAIFANEDGDFYNCPADATGRIFARATPEESLAQGLQEANNFRTVIVDA